MNQTPVTWEVLLPIVLIAAFVWAFNYQPAAGLSDSVANWIMRGEAKLYDKYNSLDPGFQRIACNDGANIDFNVRAFPLTQKAIDDECNDGMHILSGEVPKTLTVQEQCDLMGGTYSQGTTWSSCSVYIKNKADLGNSISKEALQFFDPCNPETAKKFPDSYSAHCPK